MKPAYELGVSGLRGRLERQGFDLSTKGNTFTVNYPPQQVASFDTLAELRAFTTGVEITAALDGEPR